MLHREVEESLVIVDTSADTDVNELGDGLSAEILEPEVSEIVLAEGSDLEELCHPLKEV